MKVTLMIEPEEHDACDTVKGLTEIFIATKDDSIDGASLRRFIVEVLSDYTGGEGVESLTTKVTLKGRPIL